MRLTDKDAALKAVSWDTAAYNAINMLPTIEQPQTGKWIPVEDSDCWRGYICDKCGKAVNQRENFCPNCGAKMEKRD